jgi:uncharacterized protein involved in response to NO
MQRTAASLTSAGPVPALAFAAAPHRLMFLAGAFNVLAAMAWWTLWLVDARWHVLNLPPSPIPAGWMHAVVMQYLVLPPFFFGFLFTVFPRWMNLAPLRRVHYLPVGAGFLAGQLLTLAGTVSAPALRAGILLTLAAWGTGAAILGRLLLQETGRTWHARSCFAALCAGIVGLLMFLRFLLTFDARWLFAAVQLGASSVLLPVFFTICHRMIPFFAGAVIPGYRAYRPMWVLGLAWALLQLHTLLLLMHAYHWSWLPDAPLTLLCGWLLWQWWHPAARRSPLLLVLFVGFAWLPIAMALFSAQSIALVLSGEFLMGRAPVHALFIGCLGSLLVAMVTRVTQGHSGRPLVLGRTAAVCFMLIQGVALLRIAAEFMPDAGGWYAFAAAGWLVAFAPWVVRSVWIYLTPRADGAPG